MLFKKCLTEGSVFLVTMLDIWLVAQTQLIKVINLDVKPLFSLLTIISIFWAVFGGFSHFRQNIPKRSSFPPILKSLKDILSFYFLSLFFLFS